MVNSETTGTRRDLDDHLTAFPVPTFVERLLGASDHSTGGSTLPDEDGKGWLSRSFGWESAAEMGLLKCSCRGRKATARMN